MRMSSHLICCSVGAAIPGVRARRIGNRSGSVPMRRTLVVAAATAVLQAASVAPAAEIETTVVRPAAAADIYVADGVVEAVRQTVIAAQVPGRITELRVKAGDVVKAGQTLARLDERTAAQQVAASQA